MTRLKAIWTYLGQSQPAYIRILHLIVLLLVTSQLISSNAVDLDHVRIEDHFVSFDAGTWAHIIPGLFLVLIATVFALSEFFRHGLKYFFPYVWGDLSQLKTDINSLIRGELPDTAPGGLPAIVQGLGLGALTLTLLSGLSWFFLIEFGSGLAHTAIEAHEVLANVVIVYVIGHGGMGVLHMILWMRSTAKAG
jgi:hypothetical protein